jgi:hypothetical protein
MDSPVGLLADRLEAFVRRNFPDAHCYGCLAKHLEVTEPDVRDAAQLVVLRTPAFGKTRVACRDCGRPDELLSISAFRPS